MCEVVRGTFNDIFPQIESEIRKCDFIAIDAEFTGLAVDEKEKSSLFDDGSARYTKLRKTIRQITFTQFGLSLFEKDKRNNRYEARSYNFYLFPKSFGPVDERFVCQASSLEFMCRYNFDFNKVFYEGIAFMNEEQEAALVHHIDSRAMFTGLERKVDEDSLQKVCSLVATWFIQSQTGDTFTIQKEDQEKISRYVLSLELRNRFPEVWTSFNKETKTIEVMKVTVSQRQELEESTVATQKAQDQQVLEDMLGFTRVFRVMKECKKPLIGHNCLMDLMLLYQKFHKPLPSGYTEFKAEMHKMFPKIFDTKHISNRIRRSMEEKGILSFTGLGSLYEDLSSNKGRDAVIHSPFIVHANGFNQYNGVEKPHEAGYDAFMSGFVFIRLAHIVTFKDTNSSEVIPCAFARYLSELSDYMNKVNIIRAGVMNINFGGADTKTMRQELLYVRTRAFKQRLNIDQLAKWFSAYGSVDVQSWSQSRALVATSNFTCARDILKAFKNHRLIYVTKYSFWRHSPVVRGVLWSSVLISGGLCAWALLSKDKKP